PGAPAPAVAALAAAPRALAPAAPPAADPVPLAPPGPPVPPPASAPCATSPDWPAPPARAATVVPLLPGIDGPTAASTSWAATSRMSGEYRRPSCAGFLAGDTPCLVLPSVRQPRSSTRHGGTPPKGAIGAAVDDTGC